MSFFSSLGSSTQRALAQRQQALAQQQAAYNQVMQGMAAQQILAQSQTANSFYTSTTSSSNSTISMYVTNGGSSTVTSASQFVGGIVSSGSVLGRINLPKDIDLDDGRAHVISLPDGTIIDVKADGSFEIKDDNAKVVYRASRVREFNPFLNASDRIEEFIAFCGEQGVRKGEMLELPLSLFIGWLVLEAAKADREPEPDIKLLPDLRKRAVPQCVGCGRFIPHFARAKRVEFCAPPCFERHYQRAIPHQSVLA